jgi:1,4-dihydroxy-2-naphthoate octaprenyltransferase
MTTSDAAPAPTPPSTRPTRLQAWRQALRPRVFTATYVPIGLAGVVAITDGVFQVIPFMLALIGTMCLQTTANLVNEYYDFRRGAEDHKVAGQSMVIKQGVLTPREVATGAVVSLLAGCLIGLYLLFTTGPLLLAIGLSGVIVAVAYTAGPFPLAYNGLGELAAGVFMGPMIVLGAYYVMAQTLDARLVWISLPIALTVAAILHANNLRDMDADRMVNKRTLAVILGRDAARVEYALLMGGAYAALAGLVVAGIVPPGALLAFVTLPQALTLIRTFNTETDPKKLHPAQGRTAQLHGRFGLLMALGWLLWWAVFMRGG